MINIVFGWNLRLPILSMVQEANCELNEEECCEQHAQDLMIRIEMPRLGALLASRSMQPDSATYPLVSETRYDAKSEPDKDKHHGCSLIEAVPSCRTP